MKLMNCINCDVIMLTKEKEFDRYLVVLKGSYKKKHEKGDSS